MSVRTDEVDRIRKLADELETAIADLNNDGDFSDFEGPLGDAQGHASDCDFMLMEAISQIMEKENE